MKKKPSAPIEDKIEHIEYQINNGIFRDGSHLIAFAINKFLEGQNELQG